MVVGGGGWGWYERITVTVLTLTPSFLFGFLSFLESSKSDLVNFQVGEKKFAVLAIPGSTPVIEPTIRFSVDELTEKVSGKNNNEQFELQHRLII